MQPSQPEPGWSDPTSNLAPAENIFTPRLILIPATVKLATLAAANDRERFGDALGAVVPDDWPPWVLLDVMEMFAAKLRERPQDAGWWGWYVVAREGVLDASRPSPLTLVGSCGLMPPDEKGRSEAGYSIVPSAEGRGLTTEAFDWLLRPGGWVMSQPRLRVLEATTFERHFASIRILEKSQFKLVGISPNDAEAAESDRQGRGKLLLFRHSERG